jgi:hypothetical protein
MHMIAFNLKIKKKTSQFSENYCFFSNWHTREYQYTSVLIRFHISLQLYQSFIAFQDDRSNYRNYICFICNSFIILLYFTFHSHNMYRSTFSRRTVYHHSVYWYILYDIYHINHVQFCWNERVKSWRKPKKKKKLMLSPFK